MTWEDLGAVFLRLKVLASDVKKENFPEKIVKNK
jgi:hypothetical protein